MKQKTADEQYLAIARTTIAIADVQNRELDEIERNLAAGRDAEALTGLREFFLRHRKPVQGEKNESQSSNRYTDRIGTRA
jgi:hypothetical protein